MLPRLHGAFALAILFRDHPGMLIGARLGAPLAVGYGEGENYLGSDALALAPLTQRISYLDEGDWAVVTRDEVEIFDRDNQPVDARDRSNPAPRAARDRQGQSPPFHAEGDFRAAGRRRPDARLLSAPARAEGRAARHGLRPSPTVPRITIVACGTAYYAGMVAKYWLERFARVPVELDVASRVPLPRAGAGAGRAGPVHLASRARPPTRWPRSATPAPQGQKIAVVVNVPTSSMAREADLLLPTHAGPEIGVASTKAFTCQLAVLAALAAKVARDKGAMSEEEEREIVLHLTEAPAAMNAALAHDEEIAAMAPLIAEARDVLYLGRGQDYPLALEGALKLKEISYIHAEGYAAGEMKHGPIALIDDNVPIIVIAPSGPAVREDRLATCRRSRRAAARSC